MHTIPIVNVVRYVARETTEHHQKVGIEHYSFYS